MITNKLIFKNYRNPITSKELSEIEQKQFAIFAEGAGTIEDLIKTVGKIELVDVCNEKNEIVYKFYLGNAGSAILFPAVSTNPIVQFAQHSIAEDFDDLELLESLHQAYKESNPRIRQYIDFSLEDGDEEE